MSDDGIKSDQDTGGVGDCPTPRDEDAFFSSQDYVHIFNENAFIKALHTVIRPAVMVLALLMTLVIIWSVADVVWILYNQLRTPPLMLLDMSDILLTFGAFLVTLIAIEIFMNITLYLRNDVIHVKLVVATALMAIARKVIVFDFDTIEPQYIMATAAVVLALGVTYWLISKIKE